jgi:hypothetical protein
MYLGVPASTAREAPIKQHVNTQQPPDHGAAQRQVVVPLKLARNHHALDWSDTARHCGREALARRGTAQRADRGRGAFAISTSTAGSSG